MLKVKIYRSPRFLEFVRALKCCVCGRPDPQAHHTETGGTGIKGSDLSCVPLCAEHHHMLHQLGKKTFQERFNIDLIHVMIETLRQYIMRLEGAE